MKQTLSDKKPVKKKFKIFCLSNAIWIDPTGLSEFAEKALNGQQKRCVKNSMIAFLKLNAKGAFTWQTQTMNQTFNFCVLIRCWKKYQSVAVRGGRVANLAVTLNQLNLDREQQHGVYPILTNCLRKSVHRLKANVSRQCPGTSSVTARNVPEADILSRPSPVGPLRGP